MKAQKPSISPLRQRMIEDMRMRKLGDRTQEGYLRAVRNFTKYLGRSPGAATVEDLRNYRLYLVDHGTSPASLNPAISGLKFVCNVTLDHPELMAKIQPVHLPRKLPEIMSPDEVKRLIAAAGNLKHQTALALAYATGLRVNEVVHLKVSDFDSQRMTLRVERGDKAKGRKTATYYCRPFCSNACASGGALPEHKARYSTAAGCFPAWTQSIISVLAALTPERTRYFQSWH